MGETSEEFLGDIDGPVGERGLEGFVLVESLET